MRFQFRKEDEQKATDEGQKVGNLHIKAFENGKKIYNYAISYLHFQLFYCSFLSCELL